jgi:GntR family transcriptional regulator, galactonate operon transcriptional repressor
VTYAQEGVIRSKHSGRAGRRTGGAEPATDGDAAAAPMLSRTPRGQRRSLATTVVADLVDDIVAGRYVVASALPNEGDLGLRFGVSRTVVRESVKLLQDRGLVHSQQGIGTVVRPFSSWDLIDDLVMAALVRHDASLAFLDELVVVRAGLERDMAAGAARAAPGEGDLADVVRALARMEASAEDPIGFGLADVEFHDAVMALSGNRLAKVIVTRIHDKARTTGRYHGTVSPVRVELTLEEHRQVLRALQGGDEAGAAAAMHTHITRSWARRRSAD